MMSNAIGHLLSGFLYFLPHHLISRTTLRLTRVETPWLRNFLVSAYTWKFPLKMEEASEPSISAYSSLNALFTRSLKAEARPITTGPCLISPADGKVSEFGPIKHDSLLQAKGFHYDLNSLFGGFTDLALAYRNGSFATIYLSPQDYHRMHMPCTGQLTDMLYIPGRLFSVSPATTKTIPRIFTRNERVVCLFDTEIGRLAVVFVGAINVAAIETVWAGLITPPRAKKPLLTHYDLPIELKRGAEMGRFNMGSTVIVLTEPGRIDFNKLQTKQEILFGQVLGDFV
jgi:phosphatidylserine decarboxylase